MVEWPNVLHTGCSLFLAMAQGLPITMLHSAITWRGMTPWSSGLMYYAMAASCISPYGTRSTHNHAAFSHYMERDDPMVEWFNVLHNGCSLYLAMAQGLPITMLHSAITWRGMTPWSSGLMYYTMAARCISPYGTRSTHNHGAFSHYMERDDPMAEWSTLLQTGCLLYLPMAKILAITMLHSAIPCRGMTPWSSGLLYCTMAARPVPWGDRVSNQ